MIIELHLLQSFPVSNLNRDDVGQPKTATFGGHTRGRISSQCLKRSARLLLPDYGLDGAETGVRTKRLLDGAVQVLVDRGRDATAAEAVVWQAIETMGFRVVAKTRLTQYLLFVSRQAIDLLAGYCDRNWTTLTTAATKAARERAKTKPDQDTPAGKPPAEKAKVKPDRETLKEAQRILDAGRVVDVALFGRMITDNKDFNVQAASQVAHAISTHAVVNEYDFYTAVDDLKPEAESGADMIGTVDFNAACYYRYANLDLAQLTRNLGDHTDLADRAARAWLHAFINAVPSGKQNSMAARTMPETLLTVVRDQGAWNLANAFLEPAHGTDVMRTSTNKLVRHFQQLRDFYGTSQIRAVAAGSVTADLDGLDNDEIVTGVDDLIARTLAAATA